MEWSLREAEWLGITGQGAISEFGKNLLIAQDDLGIEKALPKPVDHILIQADILKEDQAQNTCIFSTEFALRLMGDVQQYFIKNSWIFGESFPIYIILIFF